MRREILVKKIRPNPDNPRLIFTKEGMEELEESIRVSGILVPLTVYPRGDHYLIIDGERRYRAAKSLDLLTVPCYVLPPPRDKMEYLLHMFRIHNVREDWKLFPTAKKLEQVIASLRRQEPERKLTSKDLAGYVSMTKSRVSQCLALLTLPEKFQNKLLEEEKLEEKGITPTKTTLTEDLFIEILKPVKLLSSGKGKDVGRAVFPIRTREQIIEKLVNKFKAGQIRRLADFRLLSRIIKSDELSVSERAKIVTSVVETSTYRIDQAYDVHVRLFYEATALERQCDAVSGVLQRLKVERLDDERRSHLLASLIRLEGALRKSIDSLKKSN